MVFKKRHIWTICMIIVFGMINQGTWSQSTDTIHNESLSERAYGPLEKPLYCFQCNSWQEEGCNVIKPPFDASNPLLRPCPFRPGLPNCQKVVEKRKEYKRDLVIRKCAWESYPPPDCKEDKISGGSEITCQCFKDACNSAPSLPHLSSLATVVAGLLMLVGFGGQ